MTHVEDTLEQGERVIHLARISPFSYVAALLLAPVWLLLTMSPGPLLTLSSTELALTDRRVIGKHGVLIQRKIALSYRELERIHVSRGLLGWLLGFGRVTVTGFNGQRVSFKGIADPLALQQRADEMIETAILGRTLPRVEDIADNLPPPSAPPMPQMGQYAPAPGLKKTPVFGKKPLDPDTW